MLTRLLIRDPKLRLGSGPGDAEELRSHPFFSDINWERLASGNIIPPWNPGVAGSLDTSQFDVEFTSMLPTGMKASYYLFLFGSLMSLYLIVSPDVRGAYFGSLDRAFEGFSYVDEAAGRHMLPKGVGDQTSKPGAQPTTVFNMGKKH